MSFPAAATEDDILSCFRLLLNRWPSKQEWGGHAWRAGMDLTELVRFYLGSEEFRQRRLLDRTEQRWQLAELSRFKMYVASDDPAIGAPILVAHIYEPEVTKIFEQYLRPGMGVLDIGANVGYFSLLAATLVGPTGFVQSWEPSADNAKVLFANCLLNQLENIEVIQSAATDKNQVFKYFRDSTNGNVSGMEQSQPEEMLSAETVMGLRVDDFIAASAQIGFVKIDVEGHEYKAMVGARNTLIRCKPIVVSEFSPPSLLGRSGVSGREYLQLFSELGYEILAITDIGMRSLGIDEILSLYEQGDRDHIDLLFRPKPLG